MSILSFKAFTNEGAVSHRAPVCVRPLSFERALSSGMEQRGLLTVAQRGGCQHRLSVAITWDVLDRLRCELARHGVFRSDDEIVRGVLRSWGAEEYAGRLNAGAPLPAEGLVLDSVGGPASDQPRRLLLNSGLLPPAAA